MELATLVVHFVVAFFLIGVILLQHGKGADLGAAFGAGSSQTVFGPRGAASLLHKITIAAAGLFLVTAMSLTYFSRQEAASVLEAVPGEIQEEGLAPAPEAGTDTPQNAPEDVETDPKPSE